MQHTPIIIDIFVTIVDNYGDMGFVCEFIRAFQSEYTGEFQYYIWTNDQEKMTEFIRQIKIPDVIIGDIGDVGKMQKSAIGISMLHSSIPDLVFFTDRALILRVDYLSLESEWLQNNEREHILSTGDRQIIELIPSPISSGAGLIPVLSGSSGVKGSHVSIFIYPEALACFDFDFFPEDIVVYVFGKCESHKSNIHMVEFTSLDDFYRILDTSAWVIIRGEVSFAHIIQTGVPFYWNMYADIGGFPTSQSAQFLSLIQADSRYLRIHEILNGQKSGILSYQDFVGGLSQAHFDLPRTHNLIHTAKKHIDRFHNSI